MTDTRRTNRERMNQTVDEMLVDAVGTCHVPATNGARIVSLAE